MLLDTLSVRVLAHQNAVSILAFHFAHYFHFVLFCWEYLSKPGFEDVGVHFLVDSLFIGFLLFSDTSSYLTKTLPLCLSATLCVSIRTAIISASQIYFGLDLRILKRISGSVKASTK